MAYHGEFHEHVADPLYLHSNDHLGLVLITQTLIVNNYNSWYWSMCLALTGKNKFGYVDDNFLFPIDGDFRTQTSWKRNDNIVYSWLLNVVSKDIVASIIHASSAEAIWNDLRNRFQQINGPRIYQLCKEMNSLS